MWESFHTPFPIATLFFGIYVLTVGGPFGHALASDFEISHSVVGS
jgi:hypothetical protein